MNLKRFMSRFLALFASLFVAVVLATESFAVMYLPGQEIENFEYTENVTFTAQYTAVVCDAGMYLPEGGAECIVCPAGYYCLAGGAPVACPAGHYCLSGTQSANGSGLVEAGYYSTGGAKVQNPQSAEDCVGDDNVCGLIDAGYWGAAGATISTGSGKVAAGYWNNGGGTSATPTAPGNGCLANKSCGTCANWTYSGAGATSCTACPAVESGYAKLDSTGTGWTTYQKCVEIATASPTNCASGKLQKIPTASGATTWATATVNANNPLVAKPGYIVSGTACLSEGYTVSFEVNGGTDVADITCTVETADITLPTPTKTGYTFDGWYQNSALTGNAVSVIAKGTCTSAYKLYAKWTAIERKITLNANGGAIVGGSSVTPSACTVETADITLPTPTKTGYTFGGWYQNSDFSGDAISVIAQGDCLSDYTLYAKWTLGTYTILLDANGGTGGDTSVTVTFGELLPAVKVPTMSGFAFNGYWTAAEGGVQYYNTQGIALKKLDVDNLGTLYAQWVADDTCAPGTYYDSTTGTLQTCPENSYCPGKESGCVEIKCPSEYEYSVAGASEQGQCFAKKTGCSCDADLGKCNTVRGVKCTYESSTFDGVVYYSSTGENKCVLAPGVNEAMYCKFKKVECSGGDYFTDPDNLEEGFCQACKNLDDGTYTLSQRAWVKYVANSVDGPRACYKQVDLPCTKPICPIANTGECVYLATHSLSGGGYLFYGMSEPMPAPNKVNYTCPADEKGEIPASFTCNTGYDKNEDADIYPTDGSASKPEELCTPHVYTFTLDPNGGQTSVETIYEKYNTGWYSDADATTEIENVVLPTREYYTFSGYFMVPVAGAVQVEVINKYGAFKENPVIAANTTLYAIWEANTYTVQYVANQATGTMASVEHKADTPKALTPNAFTHIQNNREFAGWARTATATEPEFINNQEVVNLTAENGGNVTLYPVWKACTACAVGNDATCSLTAPVGICTYTTACTANYEKLQNAGKYNPTCSAIKYALNMETNGGVIADDYAQISQCTVESGTIVLPTEAQISREDYRFEGWYDNVATTGSAISSIPAGECTASKTLYAKWVINVEMCQPGMYYNGTSFVTCPKGYYCPGEGKVVIGVAGCRTACPNGYDDGVAGISDESQCQISVPLGSYLATAKGAEMTVCPAGKYTASAVLVSYGDTSECSSCEAGNYCDSGVKYSCATETDGVFANSAVGSANIDACYTTTVAGKYIVDNVIKTCAVPYYCPGGIKVLYGNSGGNLSCADLSDEVEWKSGITSSGASTPDMCYVQVQAGRYWNGSEFAECKVGTYKVEHTVYYNHTSSCTTCPVGYTSEAGASECYLITTAGKYVAAAGQGEVECKVGDFCPGGVKVMVSGVGGNTACATLAGGKYSMSVAGTKSADMCYSENCALSTNATQMTGKDYYGASVADTCVAVQCETGFVLANGACGSCPANSVCDPNYDAGKPHTCSELTNGKYILSLENTSSIDACYMITTPGKYVAIAGQGEVTCKVGDYCLGGAKVMYTATGGNSACATFGAGYSSDIGASEETQCYRRCAMAENAFAMSGRDYYGTADAADTCEISLCRAGYTLNNGKCELCPANNVCAPEIDSGKPKLCSDLTRGTHQFSAAGSGDVADCYMECKAYDIVYGTAVPVSETEFYQGVCRYEGKSVTGNPCDIVDGKCVEKACNYNFEMVNGKCQACARENALSYKKDGGNCVVESCVSGFHPNGQACEVDTMECSVPNAVAATRVWDASKQAFGECVITECEEGYHLGANTCQADEQVCELEHGIGIREWNHKKNTWGDCIATKCDPGYTNDRSQTNELWKQCGRCNNMYSAGGELAASSYVDGCEIATCMYEGELYTLENNECVLICDTYSDETGSRRWNASRKKCERTCEPGYMSW